MDDNKDDPSDGIPAGFVQLDPQKVWELLEGHVNVIASEEKAVSDFFERLVCVYPGCSGKVHRTLRSIPAGSGPEALFAGSAILPSFLAKCNVCGCKFEPYTKIIVERPKDD